MTEGTYFKYFFEDFVYGCFISTKLTKANPFWYSKNVAITEL